MAKLYGLFGFPLTHSFSQKYFTEKFQKEGRKDCVYENFERKNIEDLWSLVEEHPDLVGLNVTIPYKQSVLPFIISLDDVAKHIGAVNCIKIIREENRFKLHGYNTDAFGFEHSVKPFLHPHHQRALILGTGGSSKAVSYVFEKLGIEYMLVSRRRNSQYSLGENIIKLFQIIVNCTPRGMFPNVDSFPPIPYQALTPQHLLFDLVYNPAETQFMKKGKAQGATVQNGFEMLKLQAEKSWEIWNSN